ncbi:endonuclease V [bacterium]|jgi:deoxyribonuclease V|nr:endonuclease V [bacterium]
MRPSKILPAGLTPKQAVQLQRELLGQLIFGPLPDPRDKLLIAGADCSYEKKARDGYAVLVVCRWPGMEIVEIARYAGLVSFPYVPGLLSFRELPLLHAAWQLLRRKPDLVVVDGQGYAHPRRFGLACHAGLLWKKPTLGCAKSILVGEHGELGAERGQRSELIHNGEVIGMALRTRAHVRPVYLSSGFRCDLPSAVDWMLRLTGRYRQSELIRLAHREVNILRKAGKESQNQQNPAA